MIATQSEPHGSEVSVRASATSARTIKVLVVEDNEEDFHLIQLLLRRTRTGRYEAEWASTYEAAIDALRSGRHDVALFDYKLGPRTGLELLQEAGRMGCRIPIILLTGHDSPEIDLEASAIGAADYLSKIGLDSVQLERALRYSLQHAAMLEALRRTQSQLESFMHNVPCVVCIHDADGTVLFRNERFQRHFDDQAFARAREKAAGPTLQPFFDGQRHWLVNSFPVSDAQGRDLRGFAAVDITERVQAEELLLRTTKVLNGIITSLPVVVASIDEDGTVLECRGRGLEPFRVSEAELVGTNVFEHPGMPADHIRRAMNGEMVNSLWPVKVDGRTRYFENFLRFDDARGRGVIGFGVDVTARVEAELARNRRNQLLGGIMTHLPAIVGRLDANGRVVEAEGDGLACRGLLPDRLIGAHFVDLFPQSREAVTQALAGSARSLEVSGPSYRDGEWFVDFYFFHDEENQSGAIFFGRDITDRKRLERRLLGAIDAEHQRIGADLHDGLGQQLTGIACLSTALRERLRAVDAKAAAEADAVAGIANEALEQARALARGLSPVQLGQTGMQLAFEDLAAQIERLHKVECDFRLRGEAPECDHDSAVHLYRITQEAISNAIRHGHAEHITITLDTTGNVARLTIEDDGEGFDPAAPRTSPGVGLGLMEYRATIIGGGLVITSQPGQGTRVECWFTSPSESHEEPN